MQDDYRDTKHKMVWKEDFEKTISKYATEKKVSKIENMLSMMPTTDALQETTFAIEQKIKKVEKHAASSYATKEELRLHHEDFKGKLWKTFVLNDVYKEELAKVATLNNSVDLRLQTCEKFEADLYASSTRLWEVVGTKVAIPLFEDLKKAVKKLPRMSDLKELYSKVVPPLSEFEKSMA